MWTTIMGSNGNRAVHGRDQEARSKTMSRTSNTQLDPKQLAEALSDLHDLLEEYAPTWYTQEHHEKVVLALHPFQKH